MAKAKVEAVSPASDDEWRVKDALRTLTSAEEIRGDKALMAKVAKLATEQSAEMAKIAATVNGGSATATIKMADEKPVAASNRTMRKVAGKASKVATLAKQGLISDKQRAKMAAKR